MNLVIDIGNTRIKAALFNDNEIAESFIFHKENFVAELTNIARNEYIKRAIVSTVSRDFYLEQKQGFSNIEFLYLDNKIKYPININYKTPETLGKDRIALAVAASDIYPNEDVLIIDAGTCITYEFIDSTKNYLGGAISPGLQIRFKALHTFTEKLPLIELRDNIDLIGKTTEQSILSGVAKGATAEIDGIIDQYKKMYPSLKVILTGGDTNYFAKTLKNNIFANSKVLMYGLNSILNYNAK